MIDFSVVIVTRNRALQLRESLATALALQYPIGRFEVVVVDNGSTDDTHQVMEDFKSRFPDGLVMVKEPQSGISRARNAGVRKAGGSWILFIDDDALVPVDLLTNYRRWLESYPETRAWGGGAVLRYPDRLPHWWGSSFDGMLSALDLGNAPIRLRFPETPYGLNMLFDRDVLSEIGGFRDEIKFGGDETDVFWRMETAELEVRYAPNCVVVHAVDLDRFSARWLLGGSYRSGGYHATFDRLNGEHGIGWKMISSGWVKVLLGRRGFIPLAFSMHVLRIAGYLAVRRKMGTSDA